MNYIIVGEKEIIRSIVRVIPREKISYETPSTIGDVELNFHQYWVTSGDVNYILIEFKDHNESAGSNSITVFSKEDPSFVKKVNWNRCDEMSFVAINMLNRVGNFKGLTDLMEMGLKSIPLSGIDRYLEEKEEECNDTEDEKCDEAVYEEITSSYSFQEFLVKAGIQQKKSLYDLLTYIYNPVVENHKGERLFPIHHTIGIQDTGYKYMCTVYESNDVVCLEITKGEGSRYSNIPDKALEPHYAIFKLDENAEVWKMTNHELNTTIHSFFKYLDEAYPDEVSEKIKSYVSEKVDWMKKEDGFWQSIFSVFNTCDMHIITCDFNNFTPSLYIIDKNDSNETKFSKHVIIDKKKRGKDVIRSVDDFVDALKNAGLTNEDKIKLFVNHIYNVAEMNSYIGDVTNVSRNIDFSGYDDAYRIDLFQKTIDDPLVMSLEKKHSRVYADGLSLVERYDKLFVLEFEEKKPDCVYSENNEVTEEEAEPTSEMDFLKNVNSIITPYVDEVEEEMIMKTVKNEMNSFFDSTGVINPRGRWLCRNITIKLPDSNVVCEMNIGEDGVIRFSVESNHIEFDTEETINKEYLQCTIGKDSLSNKLRTLGIPEADISEFYYAFKGCIRNAIQDKNTKLGIATRIDGKNDEIFNLHIKHSSNEGVLIHVVRIKEEHRVRSIVDSVKHDTYMEKRSEEDTCIDVVRKYETTIVVTE